MTDFDSIYSAYFNDVYLYALRLCGNESTAQDICSETFFKALRGIDGFRGESSVSTWLCGIAKNCWYSMAKKQGREVPLDEDIPDKKSLEELVLEKNEAERIAGLLHELPEPYKEVFMWRVYGEKSFKEIGALFGKTDNWACVTYHRARVMILRRMEDRNEKRMQNSG